MFTFRSLLFKLINRKETSGAAEPYKPLDPEELATGLKVLLLKLETSVILHDDFRKDVEMILVSFLDLTETLSSPFYSIDEVLSDVTVCSAGLNRMLDYARTSRPKATGFGIFNIEANTILPGFFFRSETEAEAMAAQLQAFSPVGPGQIPKYKVSLVELTSTHISQPNTPTMLGIIQKFAELQTISQEPISATTTPSTRQRLKNIKVL